MKTKINKIVKFAAAGLFLIALAINVKVTLDDPFVMLSEEAIATGSSGGGDKYLIKTNVPAATGLTTTHTNSEGETCTVTYDLSAYVRCDGTGYTECTDTSGTQSNVSEPVCE